MANTAWSEDLSSNPTLSAKLSSPISPNCMFSFLPTYMHIFLLIIVTLQLCLCETFLHEGIIDSEVQISCFIINRNDRVYRHGGGVCMYLRNNLIYKICLKYSNSVCDLFKLSM